MNLRMELLDHVLILDFPHALVVKKKKKTHLPVEET